MKAYPIAWPPGWIYRKKAMHAHPDVTGGSHHRMQELNWAMDQAEQELV